MGKDKPLLIQKENPKAGVFIFGEATDEHGKTKLYAIAPWTEGMFSQDGRKAYMMPKGSVDDDTDLKAEAIREVREETGIDIAKLARGEYPGVELIEWMKDGKPIINGYAPTNRGNPAHYTVYGVRVKGIEHLREHLKAKVESANSSPSVAKQADNIAQDHIDSGRLPSFETLLQTLRTGQWEFGDKKHHGRLFDPVFAEAEKMFLLRKGVQQMPADGSMSREDLASFLSPHGPKISTPAELDAFFQTTALSSVLKNHLAKIRHFMQGKGDYAIDGLKYLDDATGLKMDVKQHPLRYYQEGADIIPVDVWIDRMVDFANAQPNGQYHLSQFSRVVDDRAPGRSFHQPVQSVADMIVKACEMAEGKPKHAARHTLNELAESAHQERDRRQGVIKASGLAA